MRGGFSAVMSSLHAWAPGNKIRLCALIGQKHRHHESFCIQDDTLSEFMERMVERDPMPAYPSPPSKAKAKDKDKAPRRESDVFRARAEQIHRDPPQLVLGHIENALDRAAKMSAHDDKSFAESMDAIDSEWGDTGAADYSHTRHLQPALPKRSAPFVEAYIGADTYRRAQLAIEDIALQRKRINVIIASCKNKDAQLQKLSDSILHEYAAYEKAMEVMNGAAETLDGTEEWHADVLKRRAMIMMKNDRDYQVFLHDQEERNLIGPGPGSSSRGIAAFPYGQFGMPFNFPGYYFGMPPNVTNMPNMMDMGHLYGTPGQQYGYNTSE